ncbi:unnamed protein product, partial [Nippostrongylus brasiliensis]
MHSIISVSRTSEIESRTQEAEVNAGTTADPCIFRESSYQVIYGIRNGIVHFRVILHGVPHMASGWTGIGFGNSMINNVMVHGSRMDGGTV